MQSDRRRAGTPPSRLPPSGLDVADLDRPIREVLPELSRGIAALARLGIVTPRQALFHLPFRYDDFSDLRPLGELLPDEKQSARVRVVEVRVEKGFGRRPQRVIAQLADESGTAEAIWFGRQFVEQRLARIAPGDELIFSGKVALRGWRPQFVGPDFSPVGADSVHTGRVVPVYRLTGGVTQKRARDLLARVLERALPAVGDPLLPNQRGAVDEIGAALASARPMGRLLQGDGGSGKTAVAAVTLAGVVRAGWQGALMAPTEILARQHHTGLAPLLVTLGVRAEFLSGSLPVAAKRRIHDAIAAGEIDVVIGTHAVISEAVTFRDLGLAVVDEQHRFGVAQRAALQAKWAGLEPHVLALTATPTPRTLALTFYGDLSISTIRELPPGRQPIRTAVRDRAALPRIEAFLAS